MSGWVGLFGAWLIAALPDALAIGGAAMTAYGAALVYEPAGYIVGGVLLLTVGVIALVRRG